MSKIEVDQIDPQSGTNLTVGSSGGTTNTLGATGDVIKTAAGTTKLEVQGDGSSAEGKIQLNCHANTHGVILQSPPHSAGQSWTLKLPENSPTADKFIKVTSISGSGSTAIATTQFADAGGGNFIKLAGGDNITADSNLYGYYTSDYYNYKWIFNGVTSSGTSTLDIRIYKSSGAISTSKYIYGVGYNYRSSGSHSFTTATSGWNDDKFRLCGENVSSSAGLGSTLIVDVYDPQASNKKNIGWQLFHERHDGAVFTRDIGAGILDDTDASTGINVYSESGNFGAEHWALYGMKV